jgi:DNA-binding SARP family transcriptional activator
MHSPIIAFIGPEHHQVKILNQSVAQLRYEYAFFELADDLEIGKCDIGLIFHDPPFSDGLELLAALRNNFPDFPVLMIGEMVAQHDIVEAFRLGANDFLFLPIQSDTLANSLYRFLPNPNKKKKETWWNRIIPAFLQKLLAPAPSLVTNGFVPAIQASHVTEPSKEKAPDIQVQLLGAISMSIHGKVLLRMPGKKAKTLLAYLLYKYPKPVHREVLIDLFWSDSSPDAARNCLNVTLHTIRKCFNEISGGKEIIVFHDESYGLNPKLEVERDVDLFEAYWKKGRQIEFESGMEAATDTYHQAFAFYRGDFMEDLPFEEWAGRERDKFRETWLVILDRLSVHFLEKKRYQICMNLCRKILEKDPCLEEVHRRLMECFVQLGMKDMAVRQFLKCRENLREELDVTPGKATAELYQKIREW